MEIDLSRGEGGAGFWIEIEIEMVKPKASR